MVAPHRAGGEVHLVVTDRGRQAVGAHFRCLRAAGWRRQRSKPLVARTAHSRRKASARSPATQLEEGRSEQPKWLASPVRRLAMMSFMCVSRSECGECPVRCPRRVDEENTVGEPAGVGARCDAVLAAVEQEQRAGDGPGIGAPGVEVGQVVVDQSAGAVGQGQRHHLLEPGPVPSERGVVGRGERGGVVERLPSKRPRHRLWRRARAPTTRCPAQMREQVLCSTVETEETEAQTSSYRHSSKAYRARAYL